jgi:Kef-type K+ transport system membrane component KefB
MTSFFLIVFVGVFFSMLRSKIRLPWVVALIIGGIIVGPHSTNLIEVTPITKFLGDIGLIFLMFMAGLETKLSSFEDFKGRLILLAFINGFFPAVVGFTVAYLFGYGILPAFLVGIIFMSSSISTVIPSLEARNFLQTRLGQSVVMTSVIQDVASLVLLSLVLQNFGPITHLPLYIFYPIVILVIIGFRFLLPKVEHLILVKSKGRSDRFQQQFRSTFLMLLGTVIAFELLGLHPIIGGFFAGFVLSETITNSELKDKIRTISYGIFVPIFFVIVGIQTDISVFTDLSTGLPLVIIIVLSSVVAKLISGWAGARIVGFPSDQAILFSVSSVAQLSTTLAVTFAAFSFDLIDEELMTALVSLSIITAMVGPTLMDIFSKRIHSSLSVGEKIRVKKTLMKQKKT